MGHNRHHNWTVITLGLLLIFVSPILLGSYGDKSFSGNLKLTADGKGLMFTSGTEELWVYISSVPASPTSEGSVGEIAFDAHHLYRCVALDTWKRVPLSAWPIADVRTIAGADLRSIAGADIQTVGEY